MFANSEGEKGKGERGGSRGCAALFNGGVDVREREKSTTSLARAFLLFCFLPLLFFSPLFFSISPLFFLTLTTDAHCSGKLGLDRKQNKCSTKPKAASCGLKVHSTFISVIHSFAALPLSKRSRLHSWLKTFLSYVLIDYCTAPMKLYQTSGCGALWTGHAL